MELTRVIHPVGQGGFYTETLRNADKEVNIVYDCGGFDRGIRRMERYLDCFLNTGLPKKKIEAIFISHFHADHINGLKYLIDKVEVKYLILPQLTDDVFIEAFVYNYCLTGNYSYTNQYLMHLYNRLRNNDEMENGFPQIIQVTSANENDYDNSEGFNPNELPSDAFELNLWNPHTKERIDFSSHFKHISTNVILYCGIWQYIPYNPKIAPGKAADLKNKLREKYGHEIEIPQLSKILKTIGVKKCKKIYTEVFGTEHNSYSMTLFSDTFEQARINRCKRLSYCNYCHQCDCLVQHRCCCNPNFLYTGDFEPASHVDDMKKHYKNKNCWDKIASIQIPHHGSKNNYDSKLYENPIRGIVSMGNNNTHSHPDINTLAKIKQDGCQPVIVTEDKSSMKIYYYKF